MAVYWVDPYIDAPIGGIHGTLDGTTRNGTYNYPFRATDVVTSGTNVLTINGVTLASGDEVRLKGLSGYVDFLIPTNPSWYNTNYYTLRTNTYDSNLAANVPTGTTAVFALAWSDVTPILLNDPVVMFTGTHTFTTGSNNIVTLNSNSGATGFMAAMYKLTGDVSKFSLNLVNPQYYIANTYLNTSNAYFCHFGTDVTVTDGWTSETVRNGKTIIVFNHSVTTSRTIYLNGTSNNTGWVLFDCPNTYFCNNNTTTNSMSVTYALYGANALTAAYRGNSYTQKVGGFFSGGTAQSFNYTGYYYSSGAGSTTSCNNSEVNIHTGYYPYIMYERYGLNTTHTIRNMCCNVSSTFMNWSNTYTKTLNIGTVLQYSGTTYFALSNSGTGSTSFTINLLDNSTFYCYTAGQSLFNESFHPYNCTFTVGANVETWTSSRLSSNKLVSSSIGPAAIAGVTTFVAPYSYSMKLNPANWYDVTVIRSLVGTASATNAYANNFSLSLHNLDCDGVDYKTVNHKISIFHSQYYYIATTASATDANIHFSLNSYDKRSIGFATSTSSNNALFYGMMYYNEPDKGNALCFQSNANQALNTQYTKLIEVTIPTYTTENIKIEVDLETSSDWNTNTAVYVLFENSSNTTALGTVKTLAASAITSKTTYSVTIPNSSLSPLGVRHMQLQFRIYNGATPSRKFYVHDVRAVLA